MKMQENNNELVRNRLIAIAGISRNSRNISSRLFDNMTIGDLLSDSIESDNIEIMKDDCGCEGDVFDFSQAYVPESQHSQYDVKAEHQREIASAPLSERPALYFEYGYDDGWRPVVINDFENQRCDDIVTEVMKYRVPYEANLYTEEIVIKKSFDREGNIVIPVDVDNNNRVVGISVMGKIGSGFGSYNLIKIYNKFANMTDYDMSSSPFVRRVATWSGPAQLDLNLSMEEIERRIKGFTKEQYYANMKNGVLTGVELMIFFSPHKYRKYTSFNLKIVKTMIRPYNIFRMSKMSDNILSEIYGRCLYLERQVCDNLLSIEYVKHISLSIPQLPIVKWMGKRYRNNQLGRFSKCNRCAQNGCEFSLLPPMYGVVRRCDYVSKGLFVLSVLGYGVAHFRIRGKDFVCRKNELIKEKFYWQCLEKLNDVVDKYAWAVGRKHYQKWKIQY